MYSMVHTAVEFFFHPSGFKSDNLFQVVFYKQNLITTEKFTDVRPSE